MPRDAKQVILHTRFSTHGSERNNENNHPVMSSNEKILLTHNGVVMNHQSIKNILVDEDKVKSVPEVDTFAIAEIIATTGVDALDWLNGYAAIAWLDSDTSDIIHLARPQDSPVNFTWLEDGSFVYASTADLLFDALGDLGLVSANGQWEAHQMKEGEYYQLRAGGIIKVGKAGWGSSYDSFSWRSATSGGHRTGYDSHGYNSYGVASDGVASGGAPSDSDWMWDDEGDRPAVSFGAPLALESTRNEFGYPESDDKFYYIDQDGDYSSVARIETLDSALRWIADYTPVEDAIISEGELAWVNRVSDIGHLDANGEEVSWVWDDDYFETDLRLNMDQDTYRLIHNGLVVMRNIYVGA